MTDPNWNLHARTVVDPPILEEIASLAERIESLAGELEKANHRYGIYDAAKLIGWLAFDAVHPGDADAVKAIEGLKSSIAKVKAV